MSSSSPPPSDVGGARRAAAARLRAAGIDTAEIEAAWLVESVTGLPPAQQVVERSRTLAPGDVARLEAAVRRREAREPLQRVLGETVFYGLRLEVRPGVLVPRPESERLVELVLADAPAVGERTWRVVDVGTGSGALALALAAARPGSDVVAGDVAQAAVTLARDNAAALGLDVRVVASDLLAHPDVRGAAERCDVLVANLPYLLDDDRARVPSEVRWDPDEALYAGRDGLAVARRLLRDAARTMRPRSTLWFELDPRNVGVLHDEAVAAGWRDAAVANDLSGRERFLRVRPPRGAARGGSS